MNQENVSIKSQTTKVNVSRDIDCITTGLTESLRVHGGVEESLQHLLPKGFRRAISYLERGRVDSVTGGEVPIVVPLINIEAVCPIEGSLRSQTDVKSLIKMEDYHLIDEYRNKLLELPQEWVLGDELSGYERINISDMLSDESLILSVFVYMYEAGELFASEEFQTVIRERGRHIKPGEIALRCRVIAIGEGGVQRTYVYGRVFSIVSKRLYERYVESKSRDRENEHVQEVQEEYSYDEPEFDYPELG